MPQTTRDVSPHPDSAKVVATDGTVLHVPFGWELLPPGDAGLTRKLKALGPTWTVKVRRRRRLESRGVWAPAEKIAEARRMVEERRSDPAFEKRHAAEVRRRERVQATYVDDFERAIRDFLAFDARHRELEATLALAVARHATPVGSGTVARTKRLPIERRAEAAVVAWLRHHTTGYEEMKIARVKGRRREVRRMLAEGSRRLLDCYRRDEDVSVASCPLRRALGASSSTAEDQTQVAD